MKKILGFKKKEQKDWIQVATWENIEEGRILKQKMNSTKPKRIKNNAKAQYSTLKM